MSESHDDTSTLNLPRIKTNNHPYGFSTSSSASSSSSSVFSIDAPSSQSSAASSSTSSLSAVWGNGHDPSYFPTDNEPQYNGTASSNEPMSITSHQPYHSAPWIPPLEQAVAPELRQHPRRTCPLARPDSQKEYPRPPPPLVRQSERKDNFVDSLVDTATQMIETIWPLSVLSYSRDTVVGGKHQNLIGLRTFVQEVLRRSKTSYSTLQVALYYLILIKSCIPKHDFTMEQIEDSPSCRAMQCGRRMFLAALILASKYLQDRNFSARAWSKISGLGTCEINANEMAFLCAVDWKLHIPEPVFHRWTDVVLKYSQSPQPPSSGNSNSSNIWESIIPTLTPELNELGDISRATTPDSGYDSPSSELDLPSLSASSTSNEQTPTNPYIIPRVLEPRPRETNQCNQILPPLPRLGPLPTPQMTPQTSNFSTPAVSAEGLCPKRPSMCAAMAQVQSACVARTTLDSWKPIAQNPFPPPTRRSSLARSTCSFSSPESMVSDVSSRSSRSSSISSVASATCALPQPRLAVQATRRCANMQLSGPMESSFSQKENSILAIRSSPECERFWERVSASPTRPTDVEQLSQAQFESFFKPPPLPPTSYKTSTQEAAESLRDLALNHHRTLPRPRPTTSRKRERPLSTDLSLQQQVRNLAPLGDIINGRRSEDDGTVLSDSRLADSFLVPKHCGREDLSSSDPSGLPITPPLGNLVSSGWMLKTALAKESASRKRPCCLKESCNVPERAIVSGPGMWAGII